MDARAVTDGDFAREHGYEPADLAARYALDTPHVSSVLLGSKNTRQLERNLATAQVTPLPPELYQQVSQRFGGNENVVSLDLDF